MLRYKGLYDIDIINIFNNRNWYQVLTDFDYLKIGQVIDDYVPSLYGVIQMEKLHRFKSFSEFLIWYIYNFTGLFYVASLIDSLDNEKIGYTTYTIVGYLDPYNYLSIYGSYYNNKISFTELIDLYTPEQLYLISELFIYLERFTDISELGMKFWIYVNQNLSCFCKEAMDKS